MAIDWETALSNISNIFVAVAAIIAAFVAARGLKTWQDELRGRAKYESARRLFLAVLQLRYEINDIRSPVQFLRKDDEDYMREHGIDPVHYHSGNPSQRQNAQRAWYDSRWRTVSQAMREIEAAELEAEVVLGPASIQDMKALKGLARELWIAIRRYIDTIASPEPESSRQTSQEVDNVIYSAKDDEFTLRLDEAVETIRAKFVTYLG